jgi:hypothetical protein
MYFMVGSFLGCCGDPLGAAVYQMVGADDRSSTWMGDNLTCLQAIRSAGLHCGRCGPGLVYHRICDDKSARTSTSLLGEYHGWVVADALGTHKAGTRGCGAVRLAACWAHVLRRFRDAVVDYPETHSSAGCLLRAFLQRRFDSCVLHRGYPSPHLT